MIYRYSVQIHYGKEHRDAVELTCECPFCPDKFLSTAILKMHIKSSHAAAAADCHSGGGGGLPTRQDGGGGKFSSSSRRYHPSFPIDQDTFNLMVSGRAEKRCPLCKLSFSNLSNLVRHFKAAMCSQKVTAPPNLAVEVRDEVTGRIK